MILGIAVDVLISAGDGRTRHRPEVSVGGKPYDDHHRRSVDTVS